MKVARAVDELEAVPRVVALGTFDGVHLGHRRVIDAALAAGPEPTVVTFDPHPRTALGNRVELLTSLERRLELLGELGVQTTLIVEFTLYGMIVGLIYKPKTVVVRSPSRPGLA